MDSQEVQPEKPTQYHGFAFVISAIKVETELPFEIAPNHWLNKATDTQSKRIQAELRRFVDEDWFLSPYEIDIEPRPGNNPGETRYKLSELPSGEKRYYVVNYEGTNSELGTLRDACLVTPSEIRLGFEVDEGMLRGVGWHAQQLHTFYNELRFERTKAKSVTVEDLHLVSEVYNALKDLRSDYEHIARAFRRFTDLGSIPTYSESNIIGLFSIIESMLTHLPDKSDPGDSLTRQIRSKFPLVRKRFARPLGFQATFGKVSEETLWSKLYAYRSRIVHGEHATIDGDLQVLRNRETVVDFLKEATKLLLIAGLREPVLMTDLKKC